MRVHLDQVLPAIDRVSPVPLYFQVEQALSGQIRDGRFAVGTRLPTEPTLAEHFAVSRSVIRQALTRLERAGLVVRRRGLGSFVARPEPFSWQLQGSQGFLEDELTRLGRRVASDVLRAEIDPLPRWAADLLGAEEGTPGVVLERRRYVEGVLTMYDLNYLPEQFATAVIALRNDLEGSLYGALQSQYGVRVVAGRRTIDAVLASRRLADLLDTSEGMPLLFVEAVDLDASLHPFDCYRTWLCPDRLKIQVNVTS